MALGSMGGDLYLLAVDHDGALTAVPAHSHVVPPVLLRRVPMMNVDAHPPCQTDGSSGRSQP